MRQAMLGHLQAIEAHSFWEICNAVGMGPPVGKYVPFEPVSDSAMEQSARATLHADNAFAKVATGEKVRTGPVGLSLKDCERPKDLLAMYATEDWASLPFVTNEQPGWRLYACKYEIWQELNQHLRENDHDSAGDPDLPWRCAGHPVPELPLSLGELTIAADTDWAALVQRILDGACPRRLDRADEGPWLWLPWLYAYLEDLP